MDVKTYQALGLDVPWEDQHARGYQVNGRAISDIDESLATAGDVHYHPCPEAQTSDDLEGEIHTYEQWNQGEVFAGTQRKISVYLPPSGYGDEPLSLLIFNDGEAYRSDRGPVRVPRVLEYLLKQGELRPTAAIFVMPGVPEKAALESDNQVRYHLAHRQRSFEYDSCTPLYGEFLLRDVLPFVQRELQVEFTSDPARRGVCGISSGGMCAFNAAWYFPGQFARVISHCGSFTNIRGANNYPYLIRSTPRKPLRVFLQSGERDANIVTGSWPLANQQMADALAYAGYDHRFEFGSGGHNLRHAGATFADTLRWIFSTRKP